jgi:hypothetical protein
LVSSLSFFFLKASIKTLRERERGESSIIYDPTNSQKEKKNKEKCLRRGISENS